MKRKKMKNEKRLTVIKRATQEINKVSSSEERLKIIMSTLPYFGEELKELKKDLRKLSLWIYHKKGRRAKGAAKTREFTIFWRR